MPEATAKSAILNELSPFGRPAEAIAPTIDAIAI
jgi:hypothetical protein